MIRNLVFDMGNVLIHWTGDLLMSWMGIENEEDRRILNEKMFLSLEWPLIDWGVLSEGEAEEIFTSRIESRLHGYVEHALHWGDMIHPVIGMADFIREKKSGGYGIYLLSNAGRLCRSYFPLIPASECFDGIVFSAEERMIKPMPEIYQTLLKRYGLNREESLFIDDLPINTAAAVHEGMKGFVFRNNIPELEKYLSLLNS